jgi:hypothetical protein
MIGRGISATTTTGIHEDGSGIKFPKASYEEFIDILQH